MKKLIVVIGENEADVLNFFLNIEGCVLYHYYFDYTHPIHIRDNIRREIEKNDNIAIATNNPYVLGEINNILYARNVAKSNPSKADEIKAIIPEKYWIEECEAYEIIKGKPISIYEEDINLIRNEAIDEASRRLNDEFDKISEYEE